jgi:hypothetical protein
MRGSDDNFYSCSGDSIFFLYLRFFGGPLEAHTKRLFSYIENIINNLLLISCNCTIHLLLQLKETVPETCIPTEPSRNVNNKKPRSNSDSLDGLSDCESSFFGSQIPLSEQNRCIICNEGGQLLTCSRKGCGITVHESCILITPSSFDKEGRFYCPCCACARAARVCARAQKFFSLARESLSSFVEKQKNQYQEKGEKGKRPVEGNINGKRKGEMAECSDDNTTVDEDGDANLVGSHRYASSDCELASRDRRRRVKNDGKRMMKHVRSNDRDASKDSDIFHGRSEEAKEQEANLAFAHKCIDVKLGLGAMARGHEAVLMNGAGNERREVRVNADANRKRRPALR